MQYDCKHCCMPIERDPGRAEVDLYDWEGLFVETVHACDSDCEEAILAQNERDNERATTNGGVY